MSAPEKPLQTPPGSDERLRLEIATAIDSWAMNFNGYNDYARNKRDEALATADRILATGRIRSLLGERAKYRARLELDHVFQIVDGETVRVEVEHDDFPDGIECRDETIRQLEASLLRVTEQRDAARLQVHVFISDRNQTEASLSALRGEVGKVLRHNVQTFRLYETLHAEKNTLEGNAKAAKNAAMAELNASLLSTLEGNDSIVSRASLPAHVAEATATDAPRSAGEEVGKSRDDVQFGIGLDTPKTLTIRVRFPQRVEDWVMGNSAVTEGPKLQRYEQMYGERARVAALIKGQLQPVIADCYRTLSLGREG